MQQIRSADRWSHLRPRHLMQASINQQTWHMAPCSLSFVCKQDNAGTASQRGIYAPCLGREHIDKAGCSRLLSMRRHQRVVSSSTELSKLVESAEEHHWEPVKRAAFLLFSICFGQVHPSRPFAFPYVVFFAPGGTHGGDYNKHKQHGPLHIRPASALDGGQYNVNGSHAGRSGSTWGVRTTRVTRIPSVFQHYIYPQHYVFTLLVGFVCARGCIERLRHIYTTKSHCSLILTT